MEDIKQSVLPVIPQGKQLRNLSPFTWTSLKFPQLSIKNNQKERYSQQQIQKPKKKISIDRKLLKTPKEKCYSIEKEQTTVNEIKLIKQKQKGHKQLNKTINVKQDKDLVQKINFVPHKIKRGPIGTKTLIPTLESISSMECKSQPQKSIKFLDEKNNMQKFIFDTLKREGWFNQRSTDFSSKLVWSNIDHPNHYRTLKPGQLYNHISGSHTLTNKDKLHEFISMKGCNFYSSSYLIPAQYQSFVKQYDCKAVTQMLRHLGEEIDEYLNESEYQQISLGEVLNSSIMKQQNKNEQTLLLLKLCLYVEMLRKDRKYMNYFERSQNYVKIHVHPNETLFVQLIQKSIQYVGRQPHENSRYSMNFQNVDYRLLVLVCHFHKLFHDSDPTYLIKDNMWISKPIASSRGAGMTVLKNVRQFYSNPSNLFFHFKNKKKYENKIFQNYISNPYLLKNAVKFSNRKFDIRQWVLITSDNNKPNIYKYHEGYCRFACEKYTNQKLDREIHLTNYSIAKNNQNKSIPSIMMLDDLWKNSPSTLKNAYDQQIQNIILSSFVNNKQIKYQEGCFQLFGFDIIFDQNQKLWLLEINLNPACHYERDEALRLQAEKMVKQMFTLLIQGKECLEWQKIFPKNHSFSEENNTDSIAVKPYYSYEIQENQSLIAYVRNRQRILTKMMNIVERCLIFSTLKYYFPKNELQNLTEIKKVGSELMKNEQMVDEPEIRFIEEKSLSNIE